MDAAIAQELAEKIFPGIIVNDVSGEGMEFFGIYGEDDNAFSLFLYDSLELTGCIRAEIMDIYVRGKIVRFYNPDTLDRNLQAEEIWGDMKW